MLREFYSVEIMYVYIDTLRVEKYTERTLLNKNHKYDLFVKACLQAM